MRGMKVGIDFGSSSIKIVTESKGLVLNEPSIVAIQKENGKPIAFGSAAFDLYGRVNEDIEIHKVIRNGAISDIYLAKRMLHYYLKKVCGNKIYKPNIIIGVPSDSNSLERNIFLDTVTSAGAGRVCLIDGILASSFGCDTNSNKLGGRMIIDIGHQTTEFAIISMGSIASKGTVRIGSDIIDKAIIKHMKKDRDIIIGPHTARNIKNKMVSAVKRNDEIAIFVSGKSVIDDLPISFEISSTEIFPIINEQIEILVKCIHSEMVNILPELLADASDHGIKLCGGGALIFDIDKRLSDELGIRCSVVDNPLNSKANGLKYLIDNKELLENNNYQFIFKDDLKDKLNKFYNMQ